MCCWLALRCLRIQIHTTSFQDSSKLSLRQRCFPTNRAFTSVHGAMLWSSSCVNVRRRTWFLPFSQAGDAPFLPSGVAPASDDGDCGDDADDDYACSQSTAPSSGCADLLKQFLFLSRPVLGGFSYCRCLFWRPAPNTQWTSYQCFLALRSRSLSQTSCKRPSG